MPFNEYSLRNPYVTTGQETNRPVDPDNDCLTYNPFCSLMVTRQLTSMVIVVYVLSNFV